MGGLAVDLSQQDATPLLRPLPALELGGGRVFTGFRSLIRVKISAVRYCRRGPTPGPMDGIEVGQSPNPCTPLAITTIAGGSIEVEQGERT